MIRRIIRIDKEKCNGCGLCANACHEGAIEINGGKASLIREDYCDGLGDCLPQCPTGAISFEEREAPAYDEAAVKAHMQQKTSCPGMPPKGIKAEAPKTLTVQRQSQLRQWPTQIKLMPVKAPFYQGARLLVAADCTAFAYASIHEEFIRNHVTVQGCPKLDNVDYSEKLGLILANNDIQEVTVLRMEVPCCGGLTNAVKRALVASGKNIPLNTVVISTEGRKL